MENQDEISKKDFRRLLEEREAEHRAKLHLEDESIDKPKLLTDKDGDVKMEASSGEESNFDDGIFSLYSSNYFSGE